MLSKPPSPEYFATRYLNRKRTSFSRRRRQTSCSGSAPVPPTRGYRVKSQWQKAVRKLSSGGTSSGSRNTSPSPTGAGSPPGPAAATASMGPRTSMEKPGWAVCRANPHAAQYRRTRHLSLNVDGGGGGGGPAVAGAAQRRNTERPPLRRGESSPLPPRSRRSSIPNPVDEFPYSPAFAYAPAGRESTHFPCGSEAVMINSALALEAFRSLDEVKTRPVRDCSSTAHPAKTVFDFSGDAP